METAEIRGLDGELDRAAQREAKALENPVLVLMTIDSASTCQRSLNPITVTGCQ